MLKIIAGDWKSRQLESPPDRETTRPYPSRVREAVFNLLRGWCEEGARVLDLYAGSGSMGLEAASRGASEVLCVEQDRRIGDLLERNVEALGAGGTVSVLRGDALGETVLLRAPRPVDLVFVDPPYPVMHDEDGRSRLLDFLARLPAVMNPSGFIVLRSPDGPGHMPLEIPGLDGPEEHRYGKGMWVLLYQPLTPGPDSPGPAPPGGDGDGSDPGGERGGRAGD